MNLKLPFGLKDGKLVEISEVERGLNCDCTCPCCGSKLIARKGEHKVAHFAHYQNPECEHGFETALHLAAKSILEQRREIRLPELRHDIGRFGQQKLTEVCFPKVTEVIVERRLGDIVPDLLLDFNGQQLLVEIAVTHFVDSEKLAKIKALGISTIEVDLSRFLKEPLDFQQLTVILIERVEQKTWVFNAKLGDLLRKKQEELEAAEKRERLEQEENTRRRREEWEKSQRKEMEEKDQREKFYQVYKKSIVVRRPKNLGSFNGEALHVDDCPLKMNAYHIGGGFYNYFANVNIDCRRCDHYRGMRDDMASIVCLHDYHVKKNKAE
ncbi:MAG: hypothetical protein IPL27_17255 [Lewinellaceae bacterium]|nr:hypothetical protein [Lewinellaceae bacterium]